MSKPRIQRRPHGPINKRFSLMWWDHFERRVRFGRPTRPNRQMQGYVYADDEAPIGIQIDPYQRGATA